MMHQPICSCEDALCPVDTGCFYVTVRDAGRYGFLLGPYATHHEARLHVDKGRRLACGDEGDRGYDGRAHFYSYGTAHLPHNVKQPTTVFGIVHEAQS